MSKLAFLSEPQGSTAEAAPESQSDAVDTPPTEGQPRGPDGKFAPKEPAQPEPGADAPAGAAADTAQPVGDPTPPAPAQPPEPVHAPLTALLDERDKRQRAEAAAATAQAELQKLRAQPPIPPPSRYEDPEGYEAYRDAEVNQRLRQSELRFSQRLATVKYGDETVQQAHQWGYAKCDADPLLNQRVMASDDPYELIVNEWKWDQARTRIDDLDGFLAWKAQQADPASAQPAPSAAPALAVPPAPPKPAPQAPPRSIASASSAGGPAVVATGPGNAYDSLFHRK